MDTVSEEQGTVDAPIEKPTRKQQSVVGEVWDFLRVRKKFWLAPILIALLLLGALFWLAGSAGVVSPFVYAL